jgi:hypothetical protein
MKQTQKNGDSEGNVENPRTTISTGQAAPLTLSALTIEADHASRGRVDGVVDSGYCPLVLPRLKHNLKDGSTSSVIALQVRSTSDSTEEVGKKNKQRFSAPGLV